MVVPCEALKFHCKKGKYIYKCYMNRGSKQVATQGEQERQQL